MAGLLIVVGVWLIPSTVRGYAPRLRLPLCALVTEQVICYDAPDATAHPITPAGQEVLDFAIAPDGNWIVYRADDRVTIAAINGSAASQSVDLAAAPPAALSLTTSTMVWSPDGVAIAYVTAGGFRVAFPLASGQARLVDVTDRLVVELRFSTDGGRLAAQADDGSWTLFAVQLTDDGGSLKRTVTVTQAADIAWLDADNLVVAPVAGGLFRISAESTGTAPTPAWDVPDEHFTKLITTSAGTVLALHPDPGDTVGSVVSISAEGRVTALGNSKIDSMAAWGADGEALYYITSGTPILIDRATGAENTLPLKRVTRLMWLPPPPILSSSVPLDADLYFLAPDSSGIRQLWWLPRSGLEPVVQVSHEVSDVRDFVVSRSRTEIIVKTGQQFVVLYPSGTPAATSQPIWPPPTRAALDVASRANSWTITAGDSSRLLVKSAWPIMDVQTADASLVKSGPSLYLRRVGWQAGPDTIQLCRSTADPIRSEVVSKPYVFPNPRLSPTGRFVAGWQRFGTISQLIIIDLESGHKLRIQGTRDISSLQWVY
jgi:hypothetical protein